MTKTLSVPTTTAQLSARGTIALCLVCCFMPTLGAQSSEREFIHPFGSLFVNDLRQVRFTEVLSHPSINIDSSPAIVNHLDWLFPAARNPKQGSVVGANWYFIPGTEPNFQKVRFQEVLDQDEARRMLQRRKRSLGDSAKLTLLDDVFVLTHGGRSVYQAPRDVEPGELAAVATIYRPPDRPGYRVSTDVIDRNGDLLVETSWLATELYRYQDGLLFEAAFDGFRSINLPSRNSLLPPDVSNSAVNADFFVDRIPQQLRQKKLQTIEAVLGTLMQQRSKESDEDAQLRRSLLQSCVTIARGALLDVEHVAGTISPPTSDLASYQTSIVVQTREESRLFGQLNSLNCSHSVFGPVLDDNSAVTLHSGLQLPRESRDVFSAAGNWIRKHSRDFSNDVPSSTVEIFCDVLDQFSQEPSVEALVKVGWTPKTEGVIYGGLRIAEHSNLLNAIASLTASNQIWPRGNPDASFTNVGDHKALAVSLPEDIVSAIRKRFFLNVNYVYLVQEGSRLWFAAGSESAIRMISDCVDTCHQTDERTRTPLLSLSVDVEKWQSYPPVDSVGVGGFLTKLDQKSYTFPSPPNGVTFGRRSTPPPDLESVLAFGGDQIARLTVRSENGSLKVRGLLGEAVAHYCIARILDYRLRWTPEFIAE